MKNRKWWLLIAGNSKDLLKVIEKLVDTYKEFVVHPKSINYDSVKHYLISHTNSVINIIELDPKDIGKLDSNYNAITIDEFLSEKPNFYHFNYEVKDNIVTVQGEVTLGINTCGYIAEHQETFEYGEEVEVSDNGHEWEKGYFITKTDASKLDYSYICALKQEGNGNYFNIFEYFKHCRKIKKEIIGYELLKDTPKNKKGTKFHQIFSPPTNYFTAKSDVIENYNYNLVINNTEWFKPIYK